MAKYWQIATAGIRRVTFIACPKPGLRLGSRLHCFVLFFLCINYRVILIHVSLGTPRLKLGPRKSASTGFVLCVQPAVQVCGLKAVASPNDWTAGTVTLFYLCLRWTLSVLQLLIE